MGLASKKRASLERSRRKREKKSDGESDGKFVSIWEKKEGGLRETGRRSAATIHHTAAKSGKAVPVMRGSKGLGRSEAKPRVWEEGAQKTYGI